MEKYIVSKRICDKPVDILRLDSRILAHLKEQKIETIRDVINNQDKIPPKDLDVIKTKIKYLVLAMDKRGLK